MKPSEKTTEFVFQEIPLSEALTAVLAGTGIYSEIKAALLEKLPEIEANNKANHTEAKAFSFGLPNGQELAEDQRNSMCSVLNHVLRKAHIAWRVIYSRSKKVFICIPNSASKTESYPMTRGPYKKHPKPDQMDDEKSKAEMASIVQAACRHFEATPDLILKGIGLGKKARQAICRVAYARNIAPRLIAPYVGLTRGGIKYNAHTKTGFADDEINKLAAFYREA